MENANRNVKDSLFRYIFKEKRALLNLYNALNGTDYRHTEDLEITTFENVIYMSVKNDVAFIIESMMNLYEHQSTVNPNMPMRGLLYFAQQYKRLIGEHMMSLYRTKLTKFPTPCYIIFYNGRKDMPDRSVLRLSDAFEKKIPYPALEVTATVLNVNSGHNRELLESCRPLRDYACFITRIRDYEAGGCPLAEAIGRAGEDCIHAGILKDILQKQMEEVKTMILTEYDPEMHIRLEREDALEEGIAIGMEKGKTIGIQEGKAIGIQEGKTIGIQEGKAIGIQEGKTIGIQEGKTIGIQEGKTIGIQEGKTIGIQEGKTIGIQEGREEGREIEKRTIVINMLRSARYSREEISSCCGLSLEDITALEEELRGN